MYAPILLIHCPPFLQGLLLQLSITEIITNNMSNYLCYYGDGRVKRYEYLLPDSQ